MAAVRLTQLWTSWWLATKSIAPLPLWSRKGWLDGERVCAPRPGESIAFEVSDAPHRLEVSLLWCRSAPLELDLRAGQTAEVTIHHAAPLFFEFYALFRPGRVLTLELTELLTH